MKKDPLVTGFQVESMGVGAYYGFELAGKDRLFLLGDFTVTHNTHIKAAITHRALSTGLNIVALAHRKELVKQISDRFKAFNIPHGVVQANKPFNPHHKVQVCSVQTLVNRMERLERPPNLILVDEAHHSVAGSWLKVLDRFPAARVLGVTATPERLDGKGLSNVYERLICGPSVAELQRLSYLAEYTYLAPPKNLAFMQEVRKTKVRAGDYARGDLELAVNKRAIVGNAQNYYAKYLNGKPAIAFCVGIQHAKDVAEQFTASGWRAKSVDGQMAAGERDKILKDFAEGRISLLTTADLISEGFDVPECAGALLLRPTKSLTLFLQQVGRTLRPKADCSKAIIIDHAGNCYDHGLPDQDRDWSLDGRKQRQKDEDISIAQCEKCFRIYDQDAVKAARSERACPSGDEPWGRGGCGLWRDPLDPTEKDILSVDGELMEVSYHDLYERDRPEWAGGLSLSLASGIEWTELLAKADTRAKLQEIAKARGYKPGWAHVQYMKRRSNEGVSA